MKLSDVTILLNIHGHRDTPPDVIPTHKTYNSLRKQSIK